MRASWVDSASPKPNAVVLPAPLMFAIDSTELGMVEEIEELRPELEPRCLRQPVSFSRAISQLFRPGP